MNVYLTFTIKYLKSELFKEVDSENLTFKIYLVQVLENTN
jgi:hypothetical protein